MTHPNTSREWYFPKLGSYQNLSVRERPVPKPKANEVLVKVHAVSLQFRDLTIAAQTYPIPACPDLVPGSDMAGEVISIGEDVENWQAGDRVCANFSIEHLYGVANPQTQQSSLGGTVQGVLTEYRAFPHYSLVRIPEHLSYEEASTLPCAALTSYVALNGPVPVKAGDYVLILGTGGVSIFALQFAVASGAIVIATSSSDDKLEIARQLGAKHVINYRKNPNWDDEVMRITAGVGVQHVVEVGGPGTLPKSIKSTAYGGNLHIVGYISKDSSDSSIVVPTIVKALNLRGVYVGSVAQFAQMNRLISANPEKTKPLIDKIFAFEDVKQAYAHLESQAHVGKIVVRVTHV